MISILWFILIFPIPLVIGLIAATKTHTYDAKDYIKTMVGTMLWIILIAMWFDFTLRMVEKIIGG